MLARGKGGADGETQKLHTVDVPVPERAKGIDWDYQTVGKIVKFKEILGEGIPQM